MEYTKVKRRYSKFTAYMLVDFTCIALMGVIYFLSPLFLTEIPYVPLLALGLLLGGLLGTFFITMSINKRTPDGERVSTWFSAYWLGWKITFKTLLKFTIILAPVALAISTDYYSYDYLANVNGTDMRLKKVGENLYEGLDGRYYTDRK